MRRFAPPILAALLSLGAVLPARAAVVLLNTDPFAGSTALATPGRQVVGGEPFVNFDPAVDRFVIDPAAFTLYGFGLGLSFVNDVVGNLPTGGANVIVLRTFDDDANPATPFAAGNAANLIAGRVTTPGAGFFIYFNQGLDLPRLVFSTDLNDNTADLKIVARLVNLTGSAGQAALGTFTASNFNAVPEPGIAMLALVAAIAFGARRRA